MGQHRQTTFSISGTCDPRKIKMAVTSRTQVTSSTSLKCRTGRHSEVSSTRRYCYFYVVIDRQPYTVRRHSDAFKTEGLLNSFKPRPEITGEKLW